MKKLSLVLAIVLICSFFVFALGSGSGETTSQGAGTAENSAKEDGKLGNYTVTIDSCRIAEDYEGKPIVIVKYTFTNVSGDEAQSFMWAFNDSVFQDGVSLNECYFVDDSANYSSDNQSKEIKKGASIEVEVAYELNDTTTDIEVEVEELISFNENKITKTFKIA